MKKLIAAQRLLPRGYRIAIAVTLAVLVITEWAENDPLTYQDAINERWVITHGALLHDGMVYAAYDSDLLSAPLDEWKDLDFPILHRFSEPIVKLNYDAASDAVIVHAGGLWEIREQQVRRWRCLPPFPITNAVVWINSEAGLWIMGEDYAWRCGELRPIHDFIANNMAASQTLENGQMRFAFWRWSDDAWLPYPISPDLEAALRPSIIALQDAGQDNIWISTANRDNPVILLHDSEWVIPEIEGNPAIALEPITHQGDLIFTDGSRIFRVEAATFVGEHIFTADSVIVSLSANDDCIVASTFRRVEIICDDRQPADAAQ